jgi:hypothetical protein
MDANHGLVSVMIIYGLASLSHFVHNAVYLDSYPNMPAWLTPMGVMACWLAIAAMGLLGYWLFRRKTRALGLAVIAVYAGLGFAGLDHFVIAPVSAHSTAMRATIVAELLAAVVLLVVVARAAAGCRRKGASG